MTTVSNDTRYQLKSQTPGQGSPFPPAFKAIQFAARGIIVHELNGKIPVADGWNTRTVAPTTAEIRGWRYGCNYGVLTGSRNRNLVVIDLDTPEMITLFEQNFSHLIDTYTVTTRRGQHKYYYCEQLPPTTKIPGKVELMADDSDGQGGKNVVGEGSIHPSGHIYMGNGKKIMRVSAIADVAAWIESMKPIRHEKQSSQISQIVRFSGDLSRYYAKILSEETAAIASAPDGAGNDTVYLSALKIFGAVDEGGIPEHIARAEIQSALAGWTYRNPGDKAAMERTIESAWKNRAGGRNGRNPRASDKYLSEPKYAEPNVASVFQNTEAHAGIFPDLPGISHGIYHLCAAAKLPGNAVEVIQRALEDGMNRDAFDIHDLENANQAASIPIKERTLHNYLKSLKGVFLQQIPIDSMALIYGQTLQKLGRTPCMYRVMPPDEIRAALRERARLRTVERVFKAILAKLPPEAMAALGIPEDMRELASEKWNQAIENALKVQYKQRKGAIRELNRRYALIETWLKDTDCTPLPEHLPRNTRQAFTNTLIHAGMANEAGERHSGREIAATYSISRRIVSKKLMDCGIDAEQQFEYLTLTGTLNLAEQVKYHAGQVEGFPARIVASKNGGKPYSVPYNPETAGEEIQRFLDNGRVVQIEYRVANRHTVSADLPPFIERMKPVTTDIEDVRPIERKKAFSPIVVKKSVFNGAGFDPAWVRGQVRLWVKVLIDETPTDDPLSIVEAATGLTLRPKDPDFYDRPCTEYEMNARLDFRMDMIGQGWRIVT